MATSSDGLRQGRPENKENTEEKQGNVQNNGSKRSRETLANGIGEFSRLSMPNMANNPPSSTGSGGVKNNQQSQYKTAHEYALAVQNWTWQYQTWASMNWFYSSYLPMQMMNMMCMQQLQQQQMGGTLAPSGNLNFNNGMGAAPDAAGGAQGARFRGARGAQAAPNVAQAVMGQVQGMEDPNNNTDIGVRYRIPSLWKRLAAEFIDFLVLFVIKLGVTILTFEYVGIVDIQKYDLDLLLSQNIDYDTAFAMTSELIVMEVINRIFICFFETLCLRRGVGGHIGGTTPGKSLMGLRVVLCEQIYEGPGPQTIRVLPASDIGLWNALVRSVIKNFSLAFFFPVCFTVFCFQHNRAAYDIIANCVVVEIAT